MSGALARLASSFQRWRCAAMCCDVLRIASKARNSSGCCAAPSSAHLRARSNSSRKSRSTRTCRRASSAVLHCLGSTPRTVRQLVRAGARSETCRGRSRAGACSTRASASSWPAAGRGGRKSLERQR
ncbi:hypothetical protein T492DRAFT_917778, partial [Pavlovales sp. CCMP2436]